MRFWRQIVQDTFLKQATRHGKIFTCVNTKFFKAYLGIWQVQPTSKNARCCACGKGGSKLQANIFTRAATPTQARICRGIKFVYSIVGPALDQGRGTTQRDEQFCHSKKRALVSKIPVAQKYGFHFWVAGAPSRCHQMHDHGIGCWCFGFERVVSFGIAGI